MVRATPPAPALEAAAAHVVLLGRSLWRVGRPVQLIETPNSWVLLAERLAYRVGKPAPGHGPGSGGDSLAAQRRHCEKEVRLNQRLEGAGPQTVLAIRGPAGSPSFGGRGEVLGYAVSMDRVSPASLGSLRLARGTLEPAHMVRLAGFVERFHRAAAIARPGMAVSRPDDARATMLATIQTALARLEAVAAPGVCELLARWLRLQAAALARRFASRLASGHVREGHGDLRLEHVAVNGDEARVFTGVEHDPARRWIDVLGDVAGLVVDLMVHGRRDLAFVFVNRYLELSGDYAGLDILRFHLVQRALQRAADLPPDTPASVSSGMVGAGEHLTLALRLAHGADPRLLITHGLPGAGKSYAAGLLLERAGAIRICSAVELRRLRGQSPWPQPAQAAQAASPWASSDEGRAQGHEGAATQMLTFERLRKSAALSLGAGFPTIVDAGCLYRWQRDGLREVAAALGAPFTILDCQQSGHAVQPGTSSDAATTATHGHDADDLEPLGELEQRCTLALASGEPLSPATLAALWLRTPAQRARLRL
jgi:uncharacterized protein